MRIIKKASTLLFLLVLSCSLSTANAQASKCYPVNPINITEVAQEIITDFATYPLISQTEIEDILITELSTPLNPNLLPPEPIITGHFAPSVLFRWDSSPTLQPNFISNAYNLEIVNQKVIGDNSPQPGVQFILPALEYHNLWLYTFYSTNEGSQSTLHVIVVDIIIIDKDVSIHCSRNPNKRLSAPLISELKISPNPFERLVNLQFELPEEGMAAIEIYDITGQLVSQALAPQQLSPGAHQFEFDWDYLPPGTYTCLFRGPNRVHSQLIIKVRD